MDGQPWFPAKDVYEQFGLKQPRQAVVHACDESHFRTVTKSELSTVHGVDVSVPNRGMVCVKEAGIYDLIAGQL